ncbi:hypothetical protein EB796_002970 [Bugula neritina]|uniref:Uncharacterized protein n=1 Tax=Bugula neritina TaxID=10212 RepID=A0A7J7KJ26_BUGNE|nr:hypothetical protein EB796_002970 [Bugula neritina]
MEQDISAHQPISFRFTSNRCNVEDNRWIALYYFIWGSVLLLSCLVPSFNLTASSIQQLPLTLLWAPGGIITIFSWFGLVIACRIGNVTVSEDELM